MASSLCARRQQTRGNFAADDLEAFAIWRRQMESRVTVLEKAVQELRRFHAPPKAAQNGRGYLALMAQYLSEDDCRELAFCMDVDWEALPGEAKRGRLLSLCQLVERQGRLYQLEQMVRDLRPNVDWPPFV